MSLADIQPYLDEPFETFLARPIEQRVMVALYYGQGIPPFAADYRIVRADPLALPPEEVSLSNTPEEIYSVLSYLRWVSFCIPEADPYFFDFEASRRMIAGMTLGAPNSEPYIRFTGIALDEENANNALEGAVTSARRLAVSFEGPLKLVGATELATDAAGRPYRVLTMSQFAQPFDVVATWVVGVNGVGTWVES